LGIGLGDAGDVLGSQPEGRHPQRQVSKPWDAESGCRIAHVRTSPTGDSSTVRGIGTAQTVEVLGHAFDDAQG
jgi:hypothetical protein